VPAHFFHRLQQHSHVEMPNDPYLEWNIPLLTVFCLAILLDRRCSTIVTCEKQVPSRHQASKNGGGEEGVTVVVVVLVRVLVLQFIWRKCTIQSERSLMGASSQGFTGQQSCFFPHAPQESKQAQPNQL
jgi:hypothetical protein